MSAPMILTIDGDPRPQVRPRVFSRGGTTFAFSPKSEWYHGVAKRAFLARPKEPLYGPISLRLDFRFERAASRKGKGYWVTKRPDLDNLEVAILNALTKAKWWTDDCLVVKSQSSKRYADAPEKPGVTITVEPLEDLA